jgi:hypothetical protein
VRRFRHRTDERARRRTDHGALGPAVVVMAANKRTGDPTEDRPAGDRTRPRILSVCRTGAGNRDC